MENKEKVSVLVEMGFTVDEAIALTTGNYRTVPDPEPAAKPEPKQEPKQDPKPEPKQDPKPEKSLDQVLEEWEKKLTANITAAVIKQNINNQQQPAQETTEDILARMLEPTAPGSEGNNGGK